MSNLSLTQDELDILSCDKSDFHPIDTFLNTLQKYISIYATDDTIYFESISFPDVILKDILSEFDKVYLIKCHFWGKVVFSDISFDRLEINHSVFYDKVEYRDMVFDGEVVSYVNTYHKDVVFDSIVFKDEVDIDDIFEKDVSLSYIEFCKEADFSGLILKQKAKLSHIKGIEHLVWDELLCIYEPFVEWDEKEAYISSRLLLCDIIYRDTLLLVFDIKEAFSEVVIDIKNSLEETSSGWSCFSWIEQFGIQTKNLFAQRYYQKAQQHLDFMETKYKQASTDLQNTIETAYLENILWQLPNDIKKEALKYVPKVFIGKV